MKELFKLLKTVDEFTFMEIMSEYEDLFKAFTNEKVLSKMRQKKEPKQSEVDEKAKRKREKEAEKEEKKRKSEEEIRVEVS